MSDPKKPDHTEDSQTEKLFERALKAASKNQGPDISFGAVRLRTGRGQTHKRTIGSAHLSITYKGVRSEQGGTLRPMYAVTIKVGSLSHKLSVGGAASWHEQHGTPVSPDAIDAIASSAISFATSPDEGDDPDVASEIESATTSAIKEDGGYDVVRS